MKKIASSCSSLKVKPVLDDNSSFFFFGGAPCYTWRGDGVLISVLYSGLNSPG